MTRGRSANLGVAEPSAENPLSGSSLKQTCWSPRSFLLLCTLGIIARVPFYFAFRPGWSADSPGYAIPIFLWRNHRFFLGARTPVYPVFLGLTQWLAGTPIKTGLPIGATYWSIKEQAVLSPAAAYVTACLQSIAGIAAACVLYIALCKLGVRKKLALGAGLFAVSIPALCLLEVNILTLSMSYALLLACLGATAILWERLQKGSRFALPAVGCGLLFGVSVLLRPDNLVFCSIILAVMTGFWAVFKIRGLESASTARIPAAIFLVVLTASPLILGWMTWNYVGIGEFRITTLTGWNRSKTVYNLFDRVDPEDRVLGGLLTASYRKRNHDGQIVRDHVWQALQDGLWDSYSVMPIEDPVNPLSPFHQKVDQVFENAFGMQAVVPCAFPDQMCTDLLRQEINLGDYVGKVSWKLIKKYPAEYLTNAAGNFGDTFVFTYLDSAPAAENSTITTVDGGSYERNDALANLLRGLIRWHALLLSAAYAITAVLALFLPAKLLLQRSRPADSDIVAAAFASATVGTFAVMCLLTGFNKEYSIPHLGILVACAAYSAGNWRRLSGIGA